MVGLMSDSSRQSVGYFISSATNPDLGKFRLSLRPIVSINLNDSNCSINKKTGEDGKVSYELTWGE